MLDLKSVDQRIASACRQPASTGDEKSLSFARSDLSRYATYCCFRDSPAAAPDPAYSGWHRSYARDNSIAEPSGLIPAGLCIDDDRIIQVLPFATIVNGAYIPGMTPQELKDFRARMGWTREELAGQLELSPSRLADYEFGTTRTNPPRPAPIPKVVELACRWFAEHVQRRPLSREEKIALWRGDYQWVSPHPGPPADSSREAIYGESERGF